MSRVLPAVALALALVAHAAHAQSDQGCQMGMAFGQYLGGKYHHTVRAAGGGCLATKPLMATWRNWLRAHPAATWETFFEANEARLSGLTGMR